ncbi:MAG: cytochrome c maturation protein CcmE [Gammaproteobacteria bacterium]|nr:cytochrome c maturation protein CcmE [Gammaproteobacteria bacterium]
MKPRQQRMWFVAIIFSGIALATVLVLLSLGENMMYFYSPSQISKGEVPRDAVIRVGGLVVNDSVVHDDKNLGVRFKLTDTANTITVYYHGILPDLFREGQGIVAIGEIDAAGQMKANEVLAKHDENYMPPEVADALKTAAEGGSMPIPDSHTHK